MLLATTHERRGNAVCPLRPIACTFPPPARHLAPENLANRFPSCVRTRPAKVNRDLRLGQNQNGPGPSLGNAEVCRIQQLPAAVLIIKLFELGQYVRSIALKLS